MTRGEDRSEWNVSKHTKSNSYLNRIKRSCAAMAVPGCSHRFNMATESFYCKGVMKFAIRNELKRLPVEFYRRGNREKSVRDSIDRTYVNALRYPFRSRVGLLGKTLIKQGEGLMSQVGHGREVRSWRRIEKSMW